MGRIAVAGAGGRVGRHVVDVLEQRGHEVVPMSRRYGVDVVTGDGLADALVGADTIIDVATGPSPDQKEATEFFLASSRNLQQEGARAGVRRLVVVSIIGIERLGGGYQAAKVAHEEAMKAGPVPVRILRAAQFHEFVEELMRWGTQGDVSYLPRMRTQLVAARSVAEALADLATDGWEDAPAVAEIAGPREELLPEMAALLAARLGTGVRIEVATGHADPDVARLESGAALPGPDAALVGPTFEAWLDATYGARREGSAGMAA